MQNKIINRCRFYADEIYRVYYENLDWEVIFRYFVKLNSYLQSELLNSKDKTEIQKYCKGKFKASIELSVISSVYFKEDNIKPLRKQLKPFDIDQKLMSEGMRNILNDKHKKFFDNNFGIDTEFEKVNIIMPKGYRLVKNVSSFNIDV